MRLQFILPLAALITVQLPVIARAEANGSAPAASANPVSFESLGYESLPLEPDGQHASWFVHVSLNGKPCKLLLDTGADFIILDSWVPERFGFATEPSKFQGMGVDGVSKLVIASIPMTLGGKTVEKQHVRAKEKGDPAPDASVQTPVAGMLGLSALRNMGVVLDFRRHTLWLPKQADAGISTLMERSHAARIPLRHTAVSKHFYAEGSTGKESLRMILDSGAERTYLSAARAEALKLPLTNSNIRVGGAEAANSRPKQGMLTDVAFGKAALPQLPVLVLPLKEVFEALSQGEAQPIDGILGADVLVQGGGVLDVDHDTLYLGGNAPAATTGAPSAATPTASTIPGHAVVPLVRTDGNQFVFTGKINGHEIRFAVDSGADSIVVHQPLAAELGIALSKSEGTARGADGKPQELSLGKIADIELPGGMHIKDQSFPFIDLGHFTEIKIGGKPAKTDALLGHNIIQAAGMILDVSNNRLLAPNGAKPGDYSASLVRIGGQPVKLLRGAKGEFYMPTRLDGEEVALLVDTGASVSTLDPKYVETKKWNRERGEGQNVQTLGQSQAGEVVTVPNTIFGPAPVASMQFILLGPSGNRQETQVEGRRVVGLLGVNVLLPLKAVLDFGSAQALFPPNARPGK